MSLKVSDDVHAYGEGIRNSAVWWKSARNRGVAFRVDYVLQARLKKQTPFDAVAICRLQSLLVIRCRNERRRRHAALLRRVVIGAIHDSECREVSRPASKRAVGDHSSIGKVWHCVDALLRCGGFRSENSHVQVSFAPMTHTLTTENIQ